MAENKKSNEKRLIDADALEEAITTDFWEHYTQCHDTDQIALIDMVREDIGNAPTVDAVEVEHGYWIDSTTVDHMGRIIEHGIDCSVCDSVFKDDSREVVKRWKERFKVCPFCGAKMDGGNVDGC